MNAEDSFRIELQQTFLTEAAEIVENMDAILIEFEKNPEDFPKIDKLFRLVHTIKGSGRIAGFNQLPDFAHLFETLLTKLRDRSLQVTPQIIDTLLSANDTIRKIISATTKDMNATCDVCDIEDKIRSIIDGNKRSKPKELTAPQLQTVTSPDKGSIIPTFLVCDDDNSVASTLKSILEKKGYNAVIADNGLSALQIIENGAIDIVLTDLKMPKMNGIEFLEALRAKNQIIPVAFISGFSTRDNFKYFLKMRVDAFIEKPYSIEELDIVLKTLIRTWNLRNAVLQLSRIGFEAFINFAKLKYEIMDLNPSEAALEDLKKQESIMSELGKITNQLLIHENPSSNK